MEVNNKHISQLYEKPLTEIIVLEMSECILISSNLEMLEEGEEWEW